MKQCLSFSMFVLGLAFSSLSTFAQKTKVEFRPPIPDNYQIVHMIQPQHKQHRLRWAYILARVGNQRDEPEMRTFFDLSLCVAEIKGSKTVVLAEKKLNLREDFGVPATTLEAKDLDGDGVPELCLWTGVGESGSKLTAAGIAPLVFRPFKLGSKGLTQMGEFAEDEGLTLVLKKIKGESQVSVIQESGGLRKIYKIRSGKYVLTKTEKV